MRRQWRRESNCRIGCNPLPSQPQGSTAASYSQLYHASSTAGGDNNGAYDPLGREETFIRGTLSASGNNTYSSAPLDTISNANINTVSGSDDTYALDALGNWSSSASGAGTGTSTAPTLSSTSRTNNSQNESTGVGSNTLTFDRDGNTLTDQAGNTYTYDAWDRPIDASAGSIVYSYLPDSAQAIRAACPGGTSDSYYSTDMQVLEEDTPSSCTGGGCCGGCGGCGGCTAPTVDSQYVWGLAYVNEMVERDDDSTGGSLGISGSGLGERIYPEQDANFNVRTLTSNSGTVLEHIDYDDYGNARILSSAYATTVTAFGSDTYNWVYGFQGGRYDPATGLYRFGARDYSPNLGRWMEQDPDGYVDGDNSYQFTDGDPASKTDPGGTSPPSPGAAAVGTITGVGSDSGVNVYPEAGGTGSYVYYSTQDHYWFQAPLEKCDLWDFYIALGYDPAHSHLTVELFRAAPGEHVAAGSELISRTEIANGAKYRGSWELVPADAKAPSGNKALVSVVYPTGIEPNLHVVEEGAAPSSKVADDWKRVSQLAQSYKWAEHGTHGNGFNAKIFNGPITHWPLSLYSRDGNNSNTFVRYLAQQMGWTVPAAVPTLGNLLPADPTTQDGAPALTKPGEQK